MFSVHEASSEDVAEPGEVLVKKPTTPTTSTSRKPSVAPQATATKTIPSVSSFTLKTKQRRGRQLIRKPPTPCEDWSTDTDTNESPRVRAGPRPYPPPSPATTTTTTTTPKDKDIISHCPYRIVFRSRPHYDRTGASALVDGDRSTSVFVLRATAGRWVGVDLGHLHDITHITFRSGSGFRATSVALEVSFDGVEWISACTVRLRGNETSASLSRDFDSDLTSTIFLAEPVRLRCLRLRALSTNNEMNIWQLYRLSVYGTRYYGLSLAEQQQQRRESQQDSCVFRRRSSSNCAMMFTTSGSEVSSMVTIGGGVNSVPSTTTTTVSSTTHHSHNNNLKKSTTSASTSTRPRLVDGTEESSEQGSVFLQTADCASSKASKEL
eukprot:PhM_4_TR388/c1_g1_i1/m.106753